MKRILIVTLLIIFGASGVFADSPGFNGFQDRQKDKEKVREKDKKPDDNRDRNKGKEDDKKRDDRRRPPY